LWNGAVNLWKKSRQKNTSPTIAPNNGTMLLRALSIFRRDTVCQIAKFIHQVFDMFDRTPMVWLEISDSWVP
jgi:hypothetical protein